MWPWYLYTTSLACMASDVGRFVVTNVSLYGGGVMSMPGRMTRREFTGALGALTLGAALGARGQEPRTTSPRHNVVMLMSDEHNPFISSLQGHEAVVTPHMERLARQGTLFEDCYCPSPLCVPSRSSFLSGLRVHEHHMYSNCNAMSFEYPSYAQVLGEQGVHTVHMGKMDVYRPTSQLGFSEVFFPGDRKKPGDINFVRRPLSIRSDGASRADGFGPRDGNPFQHDDEIMDAALEWLATRPQHITVPWTLSVCIGKPHFPHYVTPELWDMYPKGGDLPRYGADEASARHPYAQDLRAHFQTDAFSEEQVRGLRRGYLGCVTYVDRQIGRLLDAFERHNLAEDTVFIYTSDHGEMLGKFGMWWKCSLYEDSARVPLLVAGPGFDRGARVQTPVDLMDVQATLFSATSSRRPETWAGEPLQGMPRRDMQRVVFSEYHGHGTRSGAFLIRKGDWKLIYCMEAPHFLFNLAEDPEELRNLAEAAPEKRRELEEELRAICHPEDANREAHAFEERLKQQLHLNT